MYQVLWAAKYDYPAGWGIRRHAHPYFQIFFVLSGAGQFIVGERGYLLEKDMYLIIAPDENHELLKIKDGEFIVAEVKFATDEDSALRIAALAGAFKAEDSTVRNLLEGIRKEGKLAMPYYKEMIADYLNLLLDISARARLTDGQDDHSHALQNQEARLGGIPGKIAEYLNANLRSEITLDKLASSLGYNKHYLCDVFKREAGCTIREYLNRLRIEKAKELIVNSDYSLTQVGAWLGFEYPHHFDKVFKRITGVTPGQYKRQETEEYNKDILIDEGFENPSQIDRI